MDVILQIKPERLSNFPRPYDENVLVANAAFDPLQVVALHDVAEKNNAHQAEQCRIRHHQPGNRCFTGDKNNHDGNHGRNHEALQDPYPCHPGGTDRGLRVEILCRIADDREASISKQKNKQPYVRKITLDWRNSQQGGQESTS